MPRRVPTKSSVSRSKASPSPRVSSTKKNDTLMHILKHMGAEDYYHIEAKQVSDRTASHTTLEGQLAVDVAQTENEIIIMTAIAGVSPEDIEIAIAPDMLTIRGERSKLLTLGADAFYVQECYWGAFSRTVILPQEVQPDQTRALFKNGILVVTMPKARLGRAIPIVVVEDD